MAIEQQIKDSDKQFADAFNRGDLAALVALHAEDALLLSPDSLPERGSEAVKSGFKQLLDAGRKNMRFTSVELGSGGDFAYHVGQFAGDVPTSRGESKRVTGKYLDIYKPHEDGTVKIQVTSFNFDEPLPDRTRIGQA